VDSSLQLLTKRYFHPSGNRPKEMPKELGMLLRGNEEFVLAFIREGIDCIQKTRTWDGISWYMESMYDAFIYTKTPLILARHQGLREVLADKVKELGLAVFAKSDHNEVEGCDLSLSIVGIELFVFDPVRLREVHPRKILGFTFGNSVKTGVLISRPRTREEVIEGLKTGRLSLWAA
jgi:hypothetical protein